MSHAVDSEINETLRDHEALSHHTIQTDTNRIFARVHPRHRVLAFWYDKYMAFVALLGSVFIYLQAAVILTNKSSENTSLASYVILLIVSLSILVYGVLWLSWILSFSGVFASIGSILALVATISYCPVATGMPFII